MTEPVQPAPQHDERRHITLSDEQLDRLADKLAERTADAAWDRFTGFVGRSVLRNLFVVATLCVIGVISWFKLKTGQTG